VALELVQVGRSLRVRPGDGVPVDGEVLEGKSAVDESMVTGESMPAAKATRRPSDRGTVKGTGSLVMRADKWRGHHAPRDRDDGRRGAAERAPFSEWRTPCLAISSRRFLGVAVMCVRRVGLMGPRASLSYALIAAVSVLIIACPCALCPSHPDVDRVGVGKGAGAGVLIKSAEALERMEKSTPWS